MTNKSLLAAVVALCAIGTLVLLGEQRRPAEALSPHARIERATAEKTALARVPGGRVLEGELEEEHGRLIWSFDIAQGTSANVTEVQVDARSGEVVSLTQETPADQAKEAAADRTQAHEHP